MPPQHVQKSLALMFATFVHNTVMVRGQCSVNVRWMDGWMDGWVKEAFQPGGIKLICEQMKIKSCIPSSLKALAKDLNGTGGMNGFE